MVNYYKREFFKDEALEILEDMITSIGFGMIVERDYFHKNIDLWGTPEYVPIWKQLASGESKSKALPKVLTAELLVGIIESGSDIIFSFKGKRYIIISKDCMVSDQHDEKEARFFDTPRELMSNYVIDGQTLEQHLKEIEVIYIT